MPNPEKGDIKHSFADITLIKEKLNFIPNTSFTLGLKKTIEFFTLYKNKNKK